MGKTFIAPYIYDARYHAHPYIPYLVITSYKPQYKGPTDELSWSPDEGEELEVVQPPDSVATGRLHPIHRLKLSHQIQIPEEVRVQFMCEERMAITKDSILEKNLNEMAFLASERKL